MNTNTKMLLLTLVLLSSVAANGPCDLSDFNPDNPLCTTEAVSSVDLTITDAQGNTLPSATITFLINNEELYTGGCDGSCDSVTLAYEQVGRFDIDVSAPGYMTASESVDVQMDDAGCHPVTQIVTIGLEHDSTVRALSGAWFTSNLFGDSTLRFGGNGEIIGAILYDRTIAGDGNFYIAYNGSLIRGAAGQNTWTDNVPDPTRNGDIFNFSALTASQPIGFENAVISADYNTLTGTLDGVAVTYSRLEEMPEPLLDP